MPRLGRRLIQAIGSTLMLIVVSLFLAAGLDPAVRFFERSGMRRSYAVLTVILTVIAALVLFLVAIAQRFKFRGVRIAATVLAAGLMVIALAGVASLPRI